MPDPGERALRRLLDDGRNGRLSRRSLLQQLLACGIPASMAGLLLADAGHAQTAPPFSYKPTRRGGGGTLRMLYWQGPTLLNPHFAVGDKDYDACRLIHEPLAVWNVAGELLPVLAAEIPSRANGGVAADGRSVTWKLKPGVTWHDGKPFTADDVVFNAQFAATPATAATSIGFYEGMRLEKLDALTVRVRFDRPTPFWAGSYVTQQLVPRHLFAPFIGDKSREAPANLAPVGTGPYRFVEFKPGDLLRLRLNETYHMPLRPHFDAVELKGGGDAASAARAVLQTGEFDFAWNLQVEDDVLRRMEAAGKGRVVPLSGGSVEFILLNAADPWTELQGERAHPDSRHPLFTDPAVRRAVSLVIDRKAIEQFVYGRLGVATANILTEPPAMRSAATRWEFDPAKAATLLDAAGWKPGPDGVRAKGGRPLKLLFQTSVNPSRQKTQQIIKQAAAKAGIGMEIKAITGSVFFSSDAANPDTASRFQADMEMYTNSLGSTDAANFMRQFLGREVASRANKWQGRNRARWRNAEFDALYDQASTELDPARRAQLFVRMNDLLVAEGHVIPLVARRDCMALGRPMVAPMSSWNSVLDSVHDWYRDA